MMAGGQRLSSNICMDAALPSVSNALTEPHRRAQPKTTQNTSWLLGSCSSAIDFAPTLKSSAGTGMRRHSIAAQIRPACASSAEPVPNRH